MMIEKNSAQVAADTNSTTNPDYRIRMVTMDEFETQFKPLKNALTEESELFNGAMFETYGPELNEVKKAPVDKVWTLVDNDGELGISSGFHFVDRMGYFITEVAPTAVFTDVCLDPAEFFKTVKKDGELKQLDVRYDLSDGMKEELQACRANWSKARKPG